MFFSLQTDFCLSVFPTKNLYAVYVSHIHVGCPSNLTFLDFNSLTLFREGNECGKSVPFNRPEVPRGFKEVNVPRLRENDPEWW